MTLDRQPYLNGPILQLAPLQEADYHELYLAASDPGIWELHPHRDRHTPEGFELFFREALESQGALVVRKIEDNSLIGSSRYHDYSPQEASVEIGWTFLTRAHWGGAYNRELKRMMLEHAFNSVRTVYFLVAPGNLRSQRAVLKLGAEPVEFHAEAKRAQHLAFALTEEKYRNHPIEPFDSTLPQ